MALYRTVQSSFWTDTKITDDFTPEDRYFYLYLFTNPHTNLCGCYEVSIKQMANETGYSADKIEKLIDKFSNTFAVVKYSKTTKEILLVNWHKYNWNTSSRLRTGVQKEIEEIKCSEFSQYLMDVFSEVESVYDIRSYGDNNADNEKTTKHTEDEPLADIPGLILNDNTEWIPTQKLFDEYVKCFPKVNIREQFNLMRGWCLSNPTKRKTKNGITRFVNSWLSKEQDKGGQIPFQYQQAPAKEKKYGKEFFDNLIKKDMEAKRNGTDAKVDGLG